MLAIRPAARGDADALAEIYHSSAAHHSRLEPNRYHVPEHENLLEHFRQALRQEAGAAILVAGLSNRVIGFAQARHLPEPPVHSTLKPIATASVDLAVLDDYQG